MQNIGVLVKGYFVTFSMSTRTSTFCQILPEKNLIKDFNPLKKEENPPIFLHFHTSVFCASKTIYIEYKESPKNLERHILSNGPHLVSPQEAQKVTKNQNQATVRPYLWSLIDYHPVNIISPKKLQNLTFIYLTHVFIIDSQHLYFANRPQLASNMISLELVELDSSKEWKSSAK